MKIPSYLTCLLFLFSSLTADLRAHGIESGDSLETVLEALGEPIGRIDLSERTLLLYPEGQVTLVDSKVSELSLQSPTEFAEAQARRLEQREEWQQQQARLSEQRRQEGIELRDTQLASQGFTQLPAKQRVEFWTGFRSRYPDVDISEPLAEAREHYQSELEVLQAEHRLAELESRVAIAEREAAAARMETERLRSDTELYRRQRLRYAVSPVYTPYYPHPSRNIIIHTNHKEPELCDTTQRPVARSPYLRQGFNTSSRQAKQHIQSRDALVERMRGQK